MFAAASLRDALIPLGEEFETKHNITVRFSLGGSVTLSRQLELDAPGDLFISAGDSPMDNLEEEGLLTPDTRTALLTNRLVVVVPSGEEDESATLDETLARSNRIALADPKLAPAGQYAEEALRNLGLWDELKSKLVFGGDVRTALAYVESENADAGIIYLTDALNSDGVRIAHEVPSESHSAIVYPAAILSRSDRQEAAAKFLAFLQQESSRAQFQRHGFGVPDTR